MFCCLLSLCVRVSVPLLCRHMVSWTLTTLLGIDDVAGIGMWFLINGPSSNRISRPHMDYWITKQIENNLLLDNYCKYYYVSAHNTLCNPDKNSHFSTVTTKGDTTYMYTQEQTPSPRFWQIHWWLNCVTPKKNDFVLYFVKLEDNWRHTANTCADMCLYLN